MEPPTAHPVEAAVLPPWEYPWAPATGSGLLTADGFEPWPPGSVGEHLDAHAARIPVLAVGSNASPAVIRAKLARTHAARRALTIPFARVRVTALAVGHSAHVSRRGYVAAAPFAVPDRAERDRTTGAGAGTGTGTATVLVASWLDAEQLQALDATEPNYHRLRLDAGRHPCALQDDGPDGGPTPVTPLVYASVHGVLADGAGPVPLMAQEAVHRWLAERLPAHRADLLLPPEQACARLADADVRAAVTTAIRDRGLSADDGLARDPSSGSPAG